jgi:hypothetical protein
MFAIVEVLTSIRAASSSCVQPRCFRIAISSSANMLRSSSSPRPSGDAGTLALAALPVSPSRARRPTRFFLDSCRGISPETAGTAELLVSELVTNAVRFTGNSGRASLISLSLRQFRDGLLIDALSKEWSYVFIPGGGKIVCCFLGTR